MGPRKKTLLVMGVTLSILLPNLVRPVDAAPPQKQKQAQEQEHAHYHLYVSGVT